jgi:hypothetical protein
MKRNLSLFLILFSLIYPRFGEGADSFKIASEQQLDALTKIIRSEYTANKWPSRKLVCLSIEGKNANTQTLSRFRGAGLNICEGGAMWRKHNPCQLAIFVQKIETVSPTEIRVRVQGSDVSVPLLQQVMRIGDYSIEVRNGTWILNSYSRVYPQ